MSSSSVQAQESERDKSNGYESGKQHAILSILDQGLVSFANFATGVIVARACTKEEFGLYHLCFIILIVLVNCNTAIVSTPFTVYRPKLSEAAQRIYSGSTLVGQLMMCGIFSILLLLLSVGAQWLPSAEGLSPILLTLSAVCTLIFLREFVRFQCFARFQMLTVLVLDGCITLIQIGGLLFFANKGWLTPKTTFLILGVLAAPLALLWFVLHIKKFGVHLDRVGTDLRRNWKLGRFTLGHNLLFIAGIQLYPWLLVYFYGPEENGALAAVIGIINLSNPLLIGFGNYLGPRCAHNLAEHGVGALTGLTRATTLLLALVMFAFALTLYAIGGWLVTLIYGEKYAGLEWVIAVMAWSQAAWAITVPAGAASNACERPDIPMKGLLFALLVTVTVGIVLVQRQGIMGVAMGLLFSNLAACIYTQGRFYLHVRELSRHA